MKTKINKKIQLQNLKSKSSTNSRSAFSLAHPQYSNNPAEEREIQMMLAAGMPVLDFIPDFVKKEIED